MSGDESKRTHIGMGVERMWYDYEYWEGREVKCCAVVLRTSGCSWHRRLGCTMCGYPSHHSSHHINGCNGRAYDVIKQFRSVAEKIRGCDVLKIYTSGSFLDENEVPLDQAQKIILEASDKVEKIVIESRAEYVSEERLKTITESANCMEIALGLESCNDGVLKYSVNKGMEVEDYVKAAGIIRKCGAYIRTYLLLKPPLLSEGEGLKDCTDSCLFASKHSDIISINPVSVHSATPLEKLWHDGLYRPPWLWSLLNVLLFASNSTDKIIMSHPAGAGKKRGVHNCGKCDIEIIKKIREHASSQNITPLEKIISKGCRCKGVYDKIINLPPFIASSYG